MSFEVIGNIRDIETIAAGLGVRERARLRRAYGITRWRKLKGVATIRFPNGTVAVAELHWYEGHGIGRRETKIKRLLEGAA